jgi:hypothetical protein
MSNKNSETIEIKPLGFTKVEIILQFICECKCQNTGIPESPVCYEGNGSLSVELAGKLRAVEEQQRAVLL